MRIGELAKRTGVSTRAIRHYEQSGLLFSHRAENGYREFAADAIQHVQRIQVLIRNGFTLDEMRAVVSMLETKGRSRKVICGDVIRLYEGKLQELDARMAELQSLRDAVRGRLEELLEQRRQGGPVEPR